MKDPITYHFYIVRSEEGKPNAFTNRSVTMALEDERTLAPHDIHGQVGVTTEALCEAVDREVHTAIHALRLEMDR